MFEYSHFFKNFPQFVVIHTVKGFSVVDVFLELLCFLYDPMDVGNLITDSSAFSISTLHIWKFSVQILLKLSLKDFVHWILWRICASNHKIASMWNECNCVVVWTFFGIALLWDWNVNWLFPVLWWLLRFPNLLAYWVQHFNTIIF